jgi:hypothetical protein
MPRTGVSEPRIERKPLPDKGKPDKMFDFAEFLTEENH